MKKFLFVNTIFAVILALSSIVININSINKFAVAAKPKIVNVSFLKAGPAFRNKPKTEEPKIEKPQVVPIVKKETKNIISDAPSNILSEPNLTIESINLKKQLQYATIKQLDDLYSKMRSTPIVENNYTNDLCTKNKNSYVMGHSEPSYYGEKGDGLYSFSRLEEVQIGDIISVTNIQGQECQYQATEWDFVRTDQNDRISRDQLNKLFYPKNGGKSTLTLQTCQKGSSTVRLILRAEMI